MMCGGALSPTSPRKSHHIQVLRWFATGGKRKECTCFPEGCWCLEKEAGGEREGGEGLWPIFFAVCFSATRIRALEPELVY